MIFADNNCLYHGQMLLRIAVDDIRLLTKTATLYYKGGMTQQAIAERLGISRQTTGRYLKRAEEIGIVKIDIESQLLQSTELENELEAAFGLAESVVVTPLTETDQAVKFALGQAGAAFLMRRVQAGDIVGVAWSSTVLACAIQLTSADARNVTVVQMNGSMDSTTFSTRAEYIVEHIARAFGGATVNLIAPLIVDHPSIKNSLLSDSRIAATLELAGRSHVALYGVGNVSTHSSLFKAGYLDDELLAKLEASGAVGEICGRFYDARGKICMHKLDERVVAVDLDNLKTKRISVAIAAGEHKVDAILGLLGGKYCNVLITTDDTASALLSRTGR
jgi:deoxyribonucleoside regulator